MTRKKLDEFVDGIIDEIAEAHGLDPSNSQPTTAERKAGKVKGGDRDEVMTLLVQAVRRLRPQLIAATNPPVPVPAQPVVVGS